MFIAAVSVAVLGLGVVPSTATSAYHMNGFGEIQLGGGGLPACVEGTPSNCSSNYDSTFSWGELTVQGLGLLRDQEVAGQYLCNSEGDNFVSKIRGHTRSFVLTFNFHCENTTGAGPEFIDGWFSNCASNCEGAYKDVSVHPHPAPIAPGLFSFKGFFRTPNSANSDPDAVNASNGDPMSCVGGFAPTGTAGGGFSDMTLTSAAFLGACTALAQ